MLNVDWSPNAAIPDVIFHTDVYATVAVCTLSNCNFVAPKIVQQSCRTKLHVASVLRLL